MNYIQQLNNQDCGFACLKMVLAHTYKRKEFLYLKQDLNHGQYSYKDLIELGRYHGLIINGYRYKDVETLINDHPKHIMISIKKDDGELHMVILKGIFLNRFYIKDPYHGEYSISRRKFEKIWDKTILKIDEIKEMEHCPDKPYSIKPIFSLITTILRILTLFSVILGVLYIDVGIPMYVPVLLFVCYLLFEILYRYLSIWLMRKIDDDLLKKSNIEQGRNEDFINTCANFKKLEVTSIPSIVFSICISIFLVVVFVLNDVTNFIPILVIIALSLFEFLFLNPLLNNRKKAVEISEDILRNSKDKDNFISGYLALNKKAYDFGNLFIAKKVVIGAVIVLMTIMYMYFKNVTDLSFIVFYCVGYYYLHSNISYILSYKENFIALNSYRCLLMNYIQIKK